jgi:peroxiredoxin Q/BCP
MSERLSVGDAAPEFTLPDADGNEVSLRELRGKNVIVYFYPAAMTPGCTKQACDFRDSLDSLAAAGYTFPLLSDPDKEVLTAYGAFGEKTMYGKKVTGVIRSTFVIDGEGKIAVAQYNVKATGHVAKLRRDLGL